MDPFETTGDNSRDSLSALDEVLPSGLDFSEEYDAVLEPLETGLPSGASAVSNSGVNVAPSIDDSTKLSEQVG